MSLTLICQDSGEGFLVLSGTDANGAQVCSIKEDQCLGLRGTKAEQDNSCWVQGCPSPRL